MRSSWLFVVLALAGIPQSNAQRPPSRAEPVYIYASQRGTPTLDEGEGGGNPFASALVDLLGQETLTFDSLLGELVRLTEAKSSGFQRPDVHVLRKLDRWQIAPLPDGESRIALVLVYSDYSAMEGGKSLPGAKRDTERIAAALERVGFLVIKVLDADEQTREAALRTFEIRSNSSEVALIYTTGHGVGVGRDVYLLPGTYPLSRGASALKENAVPLTALAARLQARRVNLILYGGCRDNPFSSR